MTRRRVVIAGLGDSGLLTAINLAKHSRRLDIVGISAKPELVSGQELGMRLSRPQEWARDYRVGFDRYRRLGGVRTVHGQLTGLSLEAGSVSVRLPDGTQVAEPFDSLVISTGVTNGFWRQPKLQSSAEVDADLRTVHEQLEAASSVAVVGGGTAAVSSAFNIATRWPGKRVALTSRTTAHLSITTRGRGATCAAGSSLPGSVFITGIERSSRTALPSTRSPATPWSSVRVSRPPKRTRCCGRSVASNPTPTGSLGNCSTTRVSSP